MLACLKIGAVYSNIDPNSPIERLKRMLEICKPKYLFTYKSDFKNNSGFSTTCKIINYFLF